MSAGSTDPVLRDLSIELADAPGALAAMGEALGAAGVSIEGGGAWVVAGRGAAHFLVTAVDVPNARAALAAAGIEVLADREVLLQRLDQAEPGQLGAIARCMSDAGVNIQVLYSDHANRLVLVVDDPERARLASSGWMRALGTRGEA